MNTKKFEIPANDWTEIGLDNAKFILNEAQAYVKYLSDVSIKITTRAYSNLTLLTPITSVLIAFIVRQTMNVCNPNHFITYYTIVIVICLIIIMLGLGKIIMPRVYMPVGRSPIEICNDELLGITLSKELSILALILNEIENCQVKIDFNEYQNEKRKRSLAICMKSIGLLFILSIFTITVYFYLTIL